MNARRVLMGLGLLLAAGMVQASAPACVPVLQDGWIRAAPAGATALAGYGHLRNDCKLPFVVTDVRSADFAMAMIHQTTVVSGVSRMRHAARSVVPARGSLLFAPGGTHMMLMHPRRKLKEGDRVAIQIVFEDGTRLPAELVVRREAPAKR